MIEKSATGETVVVWNSTANTRYIPARGTMCRVVGCDEDAVVTLSVVLHDPCGQELTGGIAYCVDHEPTNFEPVEDLPDDEELAVDWS